MYKFVRRMKINKRFLHFKTLTAFQEALSLNRILNDSIAFIKDAKLIWTHGEYYADGSNSEDKVKHIFCTLEQYNALTEYEKDAIYFILGYIPDKPVNPDEPVIEYGYRFGDKFPFKLGWAFGGEFPVILN